MRLLSNVKSAKSIVEINGNDAFRSSARFQLVGGDHVRELAAAAEVEPVDARAEMVATSFNAVPGEHTDADLSCGLARAAERLNLTVLA